jgi:hypothetical protein
MSDQLGKGDRPAAMVPLFKGLSLLGWLGLAGLGAYAGMATVRLVSCEVRYGADRCGQVASDWDQSMKATAAGFVLLFAHSPGESGGLVQRLAGGLTGIRKREDAGGGWQGQGIAEGMLQGVAEGVARGAAGEAGAAVLSLLGPPPSARFSEGEPAREALPVVPPMEFQQEPSVAPDALAKAERRREKRLERLEAMTVAELRERARDMGLAGLARSERRDELLTVLSAVGGAR